MMDYHSIKQLAKDRKCKVKDLLALSPQNDPHYTGRPSEEAAARWFADLWERFRYGSGVHLRRVHYQAVSQDPPIHKPNGDVYENTLNDWRYLTNAAKWARYLGYVDASLFVDRRNPEPTIQAKYGNDPTPEHWVSSWYGMTVKAPNFPSLPKFGVEGYDNANLQPYHLEIWVEKTTMNDVLEPLCEQYGINLVTGAGEISITAVVNFLERARQANRPARILYISDYDPAGLGMPISIARKIEFFLQRDNLDMDIRLEPIALTKKQVQDYNLPRVPVKDTDKRKTAWVEHHGKGQVELDAIEAIHPGELSKIVELAIRDYHDGNIAREARKAKAEYRKRLNDTRDQVLEEHFKEWEALNKEYAKIAGTFQEAVKKMQEGMAEVYEDAVRKLEDVDVDVPDVPEGKAAWEEYEDLFISDRTYFTQLDYYKAYREGREV